MGNFELAAKGGGPQSVPSDTHNSAVVSTGSGKGTPGGDGGTASIPKDTHVGGPSPVTGSGKGSPGADGGEQSIPKDTHVSTPVPDTSR